ncbi:PilZ domain-containing protein [bacterium]|nr:PilZ domain-containing protein [bacterium]
MHERRKHTRFDCFLPCFISFDGGENFKEYFVLDISKGGMFVTSEEYCEVGNEIVFEIQNRDGAPIVQGKGIVVWAHFIESKYDNRRGFGVFFQNISEEDLYILEQIQLIIEENLNNEN